MRNNSEGDSTGVMIECSTQPTAAAGPIPTNHFIIIFTSSSGYSKPFDMSLFCSGRGSGLQHFLQTPKDSEVAEGGRAVLACQVPLHPPPHAQPHHHHHLVRQVGDRVGSVQWTRDGLTLGYDRDLPGFDRYSVLGTDEAGTYNLQVSFA